MSWAGSKQPRCQDVAGGAGCGSAGGAEEQNKTAARWLRSRARGAEVTLQARGWIYLV